jgi:hypothetical protein
VLNIVLDTNILISSLINNRSLPFKLCEHWLEGNFTLITSISQLEELKRVIRYPKLQKFLSPTEGDTLLEALQHKASLVEEILPCISYSPDPTDNLILATAIAGQADYLVTGDKRDLLILGTVETVRIITARDAVVLFNNNPH